MVSWIFWLECEEEYGNLFLVERGVLVWYFRMVLGVLIIKEKLSIIVKLREDKVLFL